MHATENEPFMQFLVEVSEGNLTFIVEVSEGNLTFIFWPLALTLSASTTLISSSSKNVES